jgi:predicted NBD/HSP70 family sugar kinase
MSFPQIMTANTSRLLEALYLKPNLSRIELATQLNLNKSTVSKCMAELLKAGMVLEVAEGKASPAGGRKPVYLKINENYGHIAGCEIQQEFCRVMGINIIGEVLYEFVIDGETSFANIKKTLAKIADQVKYKAKEMGIPLLGFSCGIPGIINPFNGVILESIPLNINGPFNLTREIASEIDLPVLIDNDANCCCWGEMARHKSEKFDDFLFLLAEWRLGRASANGYQGTAVGLGLVLNNAVYYGSDFSAGEFRSVFWKQGNASQFALSDEEIKKIPNDPKMYERLVWELAGNIAFIINVLNLKHIFLGGFLKSSSVDVCALFQKAIKKNSAYPELMTCDVLFASMGDNAVAYGAACHYLLKIFLKEKVLATHLSLQEIVL